MAKQYPRVEMYYDNAWQHHTSATYTRNPIQITRGRGNEQSEPVPSTATLTFDNRDGEYNPRNPSSTLYGKIGRNTPLRISNGTSTALEDEFSRTVSDSWSGGSFTWTNSGGAASDFDVNGSSGTHTHTDTNTYRVSTADSGQTDHRVRAIFEVDQDDITGNPVTVNIRGRVTDVNNYYVLEIQYSTAEVVTASISKRVAGVGSVIAGPVTIATMTGAATTDLIGELYVEGSKIYGRVWRRTADAEPLVWTVTVTDTSLTTGTNVALSGRRETGNTNANLQIRFHSFLAVPGTIRFTGEVASWTPRRAIKGDAWTDVTANGIQRRLEQGARSLRSPLFRAITQSNPVVYWPLEDGIDATQAASGLSGGSPMSVTSGLIDFIDDAPVGGAGSAQPVLSADGTLRGVVPTISGSSWQVSVWVKGKPLDTTFNQIVALELIAASSSVARWLVVVQSPQLGVPNPSVGVSAYDASGSFIGGVDNGNQDYPGVLDEQWHLVQFTVTQNGGNADMVLYVDGVSVDTGSIAITLGNPTQVRGPVGSGGGLFDDIDYLRMSHIGIWDTITQVDQYDAGLGYVGETAADRLSRLCDEEGIEFTLIGTASDSATMGPQLIDTLLANFQDCEVVDMGLLYESRHQLGIEYRTRTSLYNQTARLELDFDATEVAPPLEPVVDDLGVQNDITVSRPNGSSARVTEDTGPLSTQAPPDGVGLYDITVDVNAELDTQLADIAGWRLNLGTVDEIRYPRITADLDAVPSLEPDASRLDVGDVLTLANPPDVPDDASLLVPGYTETIGSHRRTITFNCVPASPYNVFILDTDRLATSGSTLTNAETSTSTAFELTTASGALWSTTEEPYDLAIAGERVTVTANNDSTSPQDVTVTRSVNGVVKAQSAGEAVQIFQPAVLGL